MGYARLKHLRVRGFRSFVTESEIEFPATGFLLFRGHNLDTGGSSGSGKSSLLLAITYLLGFCRFPATSLQSWLSEEPLEVTGTFEVPEGELTISRGQKLGLTLNGKKVSGSAKQLEDQITKHVGQPAELLAALTYRGQKQPGLFLSKTDAEKKEFLTTLLDLGRFETAIETSKSRSDTLGTSVLGDEGILKQLETRLGAARQGLQPAQLRDQGELDSKCAEVQRAVDRCHKQILDLRLRIRSREAEVEARASQARADAEPRIQETQEAIKALRGTVPDESSLDYSKLTQLQGDLGRAQAFLQETLIQEQARQRQQQQQAEAVNTQRIGLEKKLATKTSLEKKLNQLSTEIQAFKASLCDRCQRPWEHAAQAQAAAEAESADIAAVLLELHGLHPEIARLQSEYRVLSEFRGDPLVEELRDIAVELQRRLTEEQGAVEHARRLLRADLDREIASMESRLQQTRLTLAGEIERHRSDALEKLQGDQEKLENLEREKVVAESNVRGFLASLSRIEIDNARETERVAQAEKAIRDLEDDIIHTREHLNGLQTEYHAELDFQRLIGREGFLGAIFDEVLWEISEETNRLLAQFPNTAHVTLNFRSESTTQKGTVKKAIVPVVSIGGFEAPLDAGLSGGMGTAVELAVDLAVAEVVGRRTGAVPGWLILDESFTGLGPVEAEASMEILRAFAEDKLVLIVDHASELKSLFTEFVDVQYQGGYSRVVEAK